MTCVTSPAGAAVARMSKKLAETLRKNHVKLIADKTLRSKVSAEYDQIALRAAGMSFGRIFNLIYLGSVIGVAVNAKLVKSKVRLVHIPPFPRSKA